MRNLKKILALVLALVMSLSLMAVASADDELNLGDVSDVYAESVDVLTSLKVFQGNKGEFLPKTNITRAEVAAIIYRIVTGDVDDTQKSIYADYNKFSDVTSDAWYAGYVNYCANAEYVKGVGGGKFAPQQNVTGYEALAMILRAIGYDKNNEFTGPNWQIQTAATAKTRGIIDKIAEGTLGGAATREVVAEILCKTILVPKADYSLAFGYRITDANGKDNPTLAYETFKMEKINGVVVANEQASLEDASPLTAGQTKLNLADGASYTLNVASTLDDIGESRYVYVVPQAGSTRYDLRCSKVYDTGLNNVYDSGEPVSSVSSSTGSEQGITSIANALHYINYDQATQYEAKIRIEYVIRLRMSEYDARTLYALNGNKDNSALYPIKANGEIDTLIEYTSTIDPNWNPTITSNGYTLTDKTNGNVIGTYDHTYEYHKVINAFTKLTDTDYEYIRSIFAAADRIDNTLGNYILGEVYVGTTSLNTGFITIQNGNLVLTNGTRDVSDTMKWEDFAAQYLDIQENKAQITKNERGNRLKIVDNDNNGVADYILQTIYTVGIINANGGLDVAGVKMTDGDAVNEVTASTKVINDGEGELATGNVVIYAKIDGNARAQLAAAETAKINTVNRANKTATAVDSEDVWNESWVHNHSGNLQSGVVNLVTNTTYTLYFDLYGNLAAFTEGDNGQFVLITDGWYNNTIAGGEYAVQTWTDGHLQTTNVTENGSLFVDNLTSGNQWDRLRDDFGKNNTINNSNSSTRTGIHTIVANLENGVLTPVDKIYRYSTRYDMLDMVNNVVPGRDNYPISRGVAYETAYGANTPAYNKLRNDTEDNSTYEVRALTTTTYYYVYRAIGNSTTNPNGNVVVRTYTGYNNIPVIDNSYIEDVYVVGERAQGATTAYYTANVVVVELNGKYDGHMTDSEQVFVPDFAEVSGNLTIENVRMIRGSGEVETVKVDMRLSTLDYYDEAGALIRGGRQPGLFYMDLADGSNDTYVLKRMNADDIRANNYLAGYVEKSGTLPNNYVQVQMMVRPVDSERNFYITEFTKNTDEWATRVVDRRPEVAGADLADWTSRSVVNENLYTLSYASRNVANLEKANAAVVLAQSRGDAINNTQVHSLNERWETNNTIGNYFSNINRNEVLVRYDAAGNVIWAVSFAEGTDTSINYAQTVWYNCLPAKNYSVNNAVKFWDAPDNNGDNRITVSYAEAKTAFDDSKSIIDLNALAASIRSHKLYIGTPNTGAVTRWDALNIHEEAAQVPSPDGRQYKLEVTLNTGAVEVYYLTQSPVTNGAALVASNGIQIDANNVISHIPANWPIEQFLKAFTVTNNGTVTWTFAVKPNGVKTYEVKVDSNGNIDAAQLAAITAAGIDTSDLFSIKAEVYNEDGKTLSQTYTDAPSSGLRAARATAKAALKDFTVWALRDTAWNSDWYDEETGVAGELMTPPVSNTVETYPHVTIEDALLNDASQDYAKRIAEIEKRIDNALTEDEVKAIFWTGTGGPMFAETHYDATDPANIAIFGVSGGYKDSVINAVKALNRKQFAINTLKAELGANPSDALKAIYDKAVADIMAVSVAEADVKTILTIPQHTIDDDDVGDRIAEAVATKVYAIRAKALEAMKMENTPKFAPAYGSAGSTVNQQTMVNFMQTEAGKPANAGWVAECTAHSTTPDAVVGYLATGITLTQVGDGKTVKLSGTISAAEQYKSGSTPWVPLFGDWAHMKTCSSVDENDKAAAFVAVPAVNAEGKVIDCAFIMLVLDENDATTVPYSDSSNNTWPLLTLDGDGNVVETRVTFDVSGIIWG